MKLAILALLANSILALAAAYLCWKTQIPAVTPLVFVALALAFVAAVLHHVEVDREA